jgi:hypothetical protein
MKDPDTNNPFEKPMPGGFLSISANENAVGTGILWASLPKQGDAIAAFLRAFDAANISHELWNSAQAQADAVGIFAKFVPPTVANGKVYLATFSGRLVNNGHCRRTPPCPSDGVENCPYGQ